MKSWNSSNNSDNTKVSQQMWRRMIFKILHILNTRKNTTPGLKTLCWKEKDALTFQNLVLKNLNAEQTCKKQKNKQNKKQDNKELKETIGNLQHGICEIVGSRSMKTLAWLILKTRLLGHNYSPHSSSWRELEWDPLGPQWCVQFF